MPEMNPTAIAAHICGLCSSSHGEIVVSPMVWFPGPAPGARDWSFNVSVGGRAGKGRVRWFSINIADLDYEPAPQIHPLIAAMADTIIAIRRPEARTAIINTLRQRGATVHDMADELDAIRLCERLWPGPKVTKIRQAVERERAQWKAEAIQNRASL
jgi:hypothetical protein